MAEPKTTRNDASVEKFLNGIKDPERRRDSFTVLALMKRATRSEPRMWGSSIVGFGNYHYTYASGREGDWMLSGFSPRKQSLVVYVMSGLDRHDRLLKKLGKHKTGKSCLSINKLEDIDTSVLKALVEESVALVQRKRT
jgi:hypothetical protein